MHILIYQSHFYMMWVDLDIFGSVKIILETLAPAKFDTHDKAKSPFFEKTRIL